MVSVFNLIDYQTIFKTLDTKTIFYIHFNRDLIAPNHLIINTEPIIITYSYIQYLKFLSNYEFSGLSSNCKRAL